MLGQIQALLLPGCLQHRSPYSKRPDLGILPQLPQEVGGQTIPAGFPRDDVNARLPIPRLVHPATGVICPQICEASFNASNPWDPPTRGSVPCRTLSKNSSS